MTSAAETATLLRATLAALIMLGPTTARSGDPVEMQAVDIESLLDLSVQAATRRLERASEAPATVFVITGQDLRRHGFRTVDQALGSVPGLFAYPGRFPQVGLRGQGILGDFTSRILVLVDGHPISSNVGVDLGRGLSLPVSAITRIEVIKGPVGSVYGPSAFFGVVNLVTTAAPHGAEGWIGVESAQELVDAGEAAATWRGEAGPVEVLVSAGAFASNGRDWTYPEQAGTPGASPDGRVRDLDFGDAANAYLRLRWKGLALAASCGHAFSGLTARESRDKRAALESLVCFGEAGLESRLSEQLSLRGRVSLDSLEQAAGRPTPPPALGGIGLVRVSGYERWATGELRADWRPWDRLRVDVGSTLKLHRVFQHTSADPLTGIDTTAGEDFVTSNTWALAELRLDGGVTLHGGLTYFAHSLFGKRLTPKVAAVWQPDAADTLKAIWAGGFRPPTFVEARFADQFAFLANPDLKPETVTSLELAYEHRFGGVASLSGSLFWNRFDDLISYETVLRPGPPAPDPTNPADYRQRARNGGQLDTVGGEVALTLRFGDALEAWGGVSAQRASERARPNFPGVTANLALSTRALWRPLTLAVRATAAGPRKKDSSALPPGARLEVPTAVELGGGATLEVPGVPGLQLDLTVANVLDAPAVSPSPADGPPVTELPIASRTVRLDLRYRF